MATSIARAISWRSSQANTSSSKPCRRSIPSSEHSIDSSRIGKCGNAFADAARRIILADIRIALVGAGAIGHAHIRAAAATRGVRLSSIADPSPAAKVLADEHGISWVSDYRELLKNARPDAAIVATPNALHVPVSLDFIAARIPVLVEKPIADSVQEALRLCEAANAAQIPLLIGHHRRHNPIVRRARQIIQDGRLGRVVAVNVQATFLKPDAYFDLLWRRQPGGGPILINLIHEIDLLRFVIGEIESLQAMTSNVVRGFDVEDTSVVALQFANGALGTLTLSDTAASPWSWDLTSGENAAFFRSPRSESHFISGTNGSLTLPGLNLWHYPDRRGWNELLACEKIEVLNGDPYSEQLHHFAGIVRGEEQPIVSGLDATRTLQATQAIHLAAKSGTKIILG
jgi:predicted dehydrogenase